MTQADMDRDAIKAEFQRERGYWRPWNETLLREQPEFLLAYARYAGHPARTGSLSTRMVELIYVGLDASSSHLFESGLRIHMQKAKEAGASHQDIFDVLQLVAEQGLACVLQSIHVLAEETGDGPSQHQSTDEHAWDWLSQHDPVYAELARTFWPEQQFTRGPVTLRALPGPDRIARLLYGLQPCCLARMHPTRR
jgi:alkylhydroperoxidase/carboxymuconolactone decarboxylase family protein YurZ